MDTAIEIHCFGILLGPGFMTWGCCSRAAVFPEDKCFAPSKNLWGACCGYQDLFRLADDLVVYFHKMGDLIRMELHVLDPQIQNFSAVIG